MAGRADIMAGKAFVELGLKNSSFLAGLKNSQARLKAFGSAMAVTGAAVTAAGAALKGLLSAAVVKFADTGSELVHISERTGIAVESLGELGYAAEQSGQSMETLESSVKKMQKSIGSAEQGSGEAVTTFYRLGLSIADLAKLSPDKQFEAIAQALSKIPDPTMRAALAMQVFGKSGTALLPMMQDGAAGIEKFRKQARELGIVMSKDGAQSGLRLHQALLTLGRVVGSVTNAIGAALVPTVERTVATITKIATATAQFIRENQGLVVAVSAAATGLIAGGAALTGLGLAVSAAGTALGAIGGLFTAILSPIGLVVTGLATLGTWFLTSTAAGQDAFSDLKSFLQSTLGTISSWFSILADNPKSAFEILSLFIQQKLLEIKEAWLSAWSGMVAIINGAVEAAKRGADAIGRAIRGAWLSEEDANAAEWMLSKQRDILEAIKRVRKERAAILAHDPNDPHVMAQADKNSLAILDKREADLKAKLHGSVAAVGAAVDKVAADSADANLNVFDEMKKGWKAGFQTDPAIEAEIKANQARIDALSQQRGQLFTDAVAEAQKHKTEAGKLTPDKLPTGEDIGMAKMDTAGTFSAAALAVIGGPQSVHERTAKGVEAMHKAMEKSDRRLEKIANNLDRLALV